MINSRLARLICSAALLAMVSGCTSVESVYIPEGTIVEAPATIKVSVDKIITLSAKETTEVRLPVSKVGTLGVRNAELLVVLQLEPIVQVARAHARRIDFGSGEDRTTIEVDGYLVDGSGIADFPVECQKKQTHDQTGCDAATLRSRDDVLEVILLAPMDLGGATLMSTVQVARAQ